MKYRLDTVSEPYAYKETETETQKKEKNKNRKKDARKRPSFPVLLSFGGLS